MTDLDDGRFHHCQAEMFHKGSGERLLPDLVVAHLPVQGLAEARPWRPPPRTPILAEGRSGAKGDRGIQVTTLRSTRGVFAA